MARTFIRQDAQIGSTLDTLIGFDDAVAPAATMESAASTVADDLNNVRSMLSYFNDLQAGNWYDPLTAPSSSGDTGSIRAIQAIGQELYDLERSRRLVPRKLLVDVTVGGADNFVVLGTGELPTNTTAAVGAVTTLGTVVAAHTGTFGAHALDEVGGAHALAPKNLLEITDNAGDPILSSGRRIWGLLQTETATDGHTITDATTTRAQISFVRPNAAHTDLEAVPNADIQGQVIRYCYVERLANEDLTEQDFLARGASIDIGAGAASVTRQVAYDNQGTTPVDLTNNATLDLEGAGITWSLRDDLEANLFSVVEGSAGGTSQVNVHSDVDELDIDAALVDILSGATVGSGGTRPIAVGVTDGVLETTAGDLQLGGTNGETLLNDSNMVAEATWAGPGVKVSETTAEVAAYETAFGGEVSLMNALVQANSGSATTKVQATLTANVSASTDINGPGTPHANTDVDLAPYDQVTFNTDVDVYLNGELMRHTDDVVAGGTPADGDLQFLFNLKGTGSKPDQITVRVHGQ